MAKVFAVIGGDMRQRYLAEELARVGCRTERFAVPDLPDTRGSLTEVIRRSEYVILPMPSFEKSGSIRNTENQNITPREIGDALREDAVVFVGKNHDCTKSWDCTLLDYAAWEDLAIENAVSTAEGAIEIAMEQLPETIQGSRFLVIGAGRIGMCLARKLKLLGAHVTVSARRPSDFAKLRSEDFDIELTGKYNLGLHHYQCVMNTVPAKVFDAAQLEQLDADCIWIELASAPYGCSPEECRMLGRRWFSGAALPGRVAPKTAGVLIAEAILRHLREREAG